MSEGNSKSGSGAAANDTASGMTSAPAWPAPKNVSGGFDPGDDDDREIRAMKSRRLRNLGLVGGVVAAGVIAGIVLMAKQSEAPRLPVDEAVAKKAELFMLPKDQQQAAWREWAASDRSAVLQREALKQLVFAKDPAGVDLALAALKSNDQSVQSVAAMALAEYGLPLAARAVPELLALLPTAETGSRPQIAWALIVLKEKSAFPALLPLYKSGQLSTVQNLDGNAVFDPARLADLVGLDELVALAFVKDQKDAKDAAVRQLVATTLSRHADPKYTDALIRLLKDPEPAVSLQAAPGLGLIGGEAAGQALVDALDGADQERREDLLVAIRDGVGARGLLAALARVKADTPQRDWGRRAQLFKMIRELADPSAADALAASLEAAPHHHWETQAALALAELGDLRAVPSLAKRLRMNPDKVYSDKLDAEMRMKLDDGLRVETARMLADLAALHPEKAEAIRAEAEDAVIFWIHDKPAPHANGLRALAAMGSTKDVRALRTWAAAKVALPLEGQRPPPPTEFSHAQTALRYAGRLKDEGSWPLLLSGLKRRPADLDLSWDNLYAQQGLSVIWGSVHAIAVGAAQGLSEWGSSKAFAPLLAYIEEPKEDDQSRQEACAALGWVATAAERPAILAKVKEYASTEKADVIRRSCLLFALQQRPDAALNAELLGMMTPEAPTAVLWQLAQALGYAGLDAATTATLFTAAETDALRGPALLALMLGGAPDAAARAALKLAALDAAYSEEVKGKWYRALGYWSTDDLETGRIVRYARNAKAMARVSYKEQAQEWASVLLRKQLDTLQFDNGPHSFTRVVLRAKLLELVRGDDEARRADAIELLQFAGERGALLSLRGEAGEVGRLATAAYHELLHPKVVAGVVIPSDEGQAAPALK